MPDGTWYETLLTCITSYYRQCYTEMYVRWNLVRKPFNQRYMEQLLTMHENEVTNSSTTAHDGICFYRIPIMNCKALKELRALSGHFGPPTRQKMKFAFHRILLIRVLEQCPSVQVLHKFDFYRCYGNKSGRQNRLKI